MQGGSLDRVDRRLAAIFAVDVGGYSRLTEADERGTLERLKMLHRELVDSRIAEHRGTPSVRCSDEVAMPRRPPHSVYWSRCEKRLTFSRPPRSTFGPFTFAGGYLPRQRDLEFESGLLERGVSPCLESRRANWKL